MTAGDPGVLKRNFSATAIQTSLVNSITAAATGDTTTSVAVVSVSGFPSTVPYTLILDPDGSKEEVVTVTGATSTTLIITRGQDNTQAVSHAAGTSVRHGVSGRDFKEEQTHQAARGYDNDTAILASAGLTHIHGLAANDGNVVGSLQAVTLTRKTLTTPTINGATLTGTVSSTASIVVSGAGTITGLSSAGMVSSSAAPKDYVDSILGSATAASTSATSAATSATSAAASATAAATSATSAAASATAAATSASSALTSQTAAATSATSAAASATAATTSAASAATSATSAATSATTAQAWATQLVTPVSGSDYSAKYNANLAATSATAAVTSATSAAASATAASTSATSAAASATAAATSAASAAAAMTNAVDKTLIDAKGDLFVGSAADTVARLGIGTDGYLLTAASTATNGVTWAAAPVSLPAQSTHNGQYLTTDGSAASWATVPVPVAQTTEPSSPTDGLIWVDTDGSTTDAAFIPKSTVTAKGNLIVGTGSATVDKLAVGSDSQILVADSTASTGLKWATAASGSTYSGCSAYRSSSQTLSAGAYTAIQWDTESWDTNTFHDTSTNPSRFTVPSGKAGYYAYKWNLGVGAITGDTYFHVRVNGTTIWNFSWDLNNPTNLQGDVTLNLAVGDYVELFVYYATAIVTSTYSEAKCSFDYLGA